MEQQIKKKHIQWRAEEIRIIANEKNYRTGNGQYGRYQFFQIWISGAYVGAAYYGDESIRNITKIFDAIGHFISKEYNGTKQLQFVIEHWGDIEGEPDREYMLCDNNYEKIKKDVVNADEMFEKKEMDYDWLNDE